MERANGPASRLVNIGLVSGLEYANLDFIRRMVRYIDETRYRLILTADVVACKVAEREALSKNIMTRWVKWRCRPWKIIPFCTQLVLLYDGGNIEPLSDLAQFAMRNAPDTHFAVFGPDGPIPNGVDFLRRGNATVQLKRRGWGHGDTNYSGNQSAVVGGTVPPIRDSGPRGRHEPRGLPRETVV